MAPKKLSESNKQEILDRYCHSDETTVTLAADYGVSTSTISRILKQGLSEEDYEAVVQRKRQGRSLAEQDLLPGIFSLDEDQEAEDLDQMDASPQRRQRKRSASGFISAEQLAASVAHLSQLELAPAARNSVGELEPEELEVITSSVETAIAAADNFTDLEPEEEIEDLEAEEDIEEDLDDDLEAEDLDDLEDDLEDDFDEGGSDDLGSLDSMQIPASGLLQILPLADAALPRTCYVVVDRSSELITRPLKDFAELGQVMNEEVQERTLPIFDNHRVAKRFLRRMQRIVKVPDGRIFQKVKPYLQAKGITHLLIDGQVYSLQ